jgi:adenylosuccinate synthase
MPVSIVVGGQFGSEGKGKVAHEIVRRDSSCVAAIRVGGTNSGHTAIDKNGRTVVLRQLPVAMIDGNVKAVLPAGAYIDPEIFQQEIDLLGLKPSQVLVSPLARIITAEHKAWEAASHLNASIGSTQSGTGAAVLASVAREAKGFPLAGLLAEHVEQLHPYLADTTGALRTWLVEGMRVVIEGTQGFGLSVLHGGYWPKATSRDTTAAGFLSEAGLSPLDVDDVTLVIRCHPIRVAGDSGPLVGETSWEQIAMESGMSQVHREFTTVTKRLRRVGRFDADLVRRAINVNKPTRIVLNHLDYIDWNVSTGLSEKARVYVQNIEREIDQKIDWLGVGPGGFVSRLSLVGV